MNSCQSLPTMLAYVLRSTPPASPVDLPRAADYDPALAARYRLAANSQTKITHPAPIRAEVIRFSVQHQVEGNALGV